MSSKLYQFHSTDKEIVIIRFIFIVAFIYLSTLSLSLQAVEVIAHPSVNVASLTTSQLRRIYSMRQVKWSNGVPIVVFVLPSKSITHQNFCKESLKVFPYQLDRIWNKLTFSGLGVAPTVVETSTELLLAVKRTPGAIGYIESIIKEEEINVITINN
ncbi:hypothetical protein [Thalassotalea piscium]|uniref:ABC-type phosphate transport system substrate-binding protein n=1 Tax=Thalassotalea piscium TaxID=1230533 RepID=A0A7X0NJ51_9GAMM|nr:hypothetical protein [Thalassotalea piscium]MBB6544251.1 ABC-type phosphate transport system substrate-binding protein [Thalassotalea piscium]